MTQGDLIKNIYYRDSENSDHKIDVLFETERGWYLYKDFTLQMVSKPVPDNWTLFNFFNEYCNTDLHRTVSSVKLDEDMSLLVLLGSGDFLVVYFNAARIVGTNSAQVIDIFQKNDLSESFKGLFRTAKDIFA